MLIKTNSTAETAVDENQIKFIKENIKNISGNTKEEYMRKKLPYCVQRVDDESFLFFNRNYEVIHNLILTTNEDENYDKNPMNFINLNIKVKLLEEYVFYNDTCPIWASKKNFNIYLNELNKFLEILSSTDFINEKNSKHFSVRKY